MHTVGAFEAKTHFSALLDQVENGEQVLITKHGRAVAQLSPVNCTNKAKISEAIAIIKEIQGTYTLGGLDWKALRDEGRK